MAGTLLWSDPSYSNLDAYPWAIALQLASKIDQPDLWLDPGYVNYADIWANLPQVINDSTQQTLHQIASRHPLLASAVTALLNQVGSAGETFLTERLYGTNYNRLKTLKHQYDGTNQLHHWFDLF